MYGPHFCVHVVCPCTHFASLHCLFVCLHHVPIQFRHLCSRTVNLSSHMSLPIPACSTCAQLTPCVPPVWRWVGMFTQVLTVLAKGFGVSSATPTPRTAAQGYGHKHTATSAKCSRKAETCKARWGRRQSPRHSRTSGVNSVLPQVPPTSS